MRGFRFQNLHGWHLLFWVFVAGCGAATRKVCFASLRLRLDRDQNLLPIPFRHSKSLIIIGWNVGQCVTAADGTSFTFPMYQKTLSPRPLHPCRFVPFLSVSFTRDKDTIVP